MSAPTPQCIAEWLEKLGVGQYAERFVENEIDVSVLPHLTDQDLKDIGVPLGHRRKQERLRQHLRRPAHRHRMTPPNVAKSPSCSLT
jgi:hypothetical protein